MQALFGERALNLNICLAFGRHFGFAKRLGLGGVKGGTSKTVTPLTTSFDSLLSPQFNSALVRAQSELRAKT